MEESLFDQYLAYTEDTESPKIFHRWCIITAIGALLGRNFWFEHGHFNVYPNLYCMLIGSPGTRKSSAIKLSRKLLIGAGYNTIAADKTTKEKFLVDLEGDEDGDFLLKYDKQMEKNLWGDNQAPREVFVMADEFNDFIGINNVEFISLLGTLWDFHGIYESRIKHGKSVAIFNPTVSILGANTQQGFAMAFPPEIVGQGFLSRLIVVYGESNGKRITFPKKPAEETTMHLTRILQEIQLKVRGRAQVSSGASKTLDSIYRSWAEIPDGRFRFYSTRRFTQLLKLSLIYCAASNTTEIESSHVIGANTVLTAAEVLMPKALGEFGKSKTSAVANKIVEFLTGQNRALKVAEIWKEVHKDLEKITDLAPLLTGLEQAERIFHVAGKGWLIKPHKKQTFEFFDANYLTAEEREYL